MRVDLPDTTRIIDLIRYANALGKRVTWKPDGFRYRAHVEEAANDQPSVVTRLRPRLRLVDSRHP